MIDLARLCNQILTVYFHSTSSSSPRTSDSEANKFTLVNDPFRFTSQLWVTFGFTLDASSRLHRTFHGRTRCIDSRLVTIRLDIEMCVSQRLQVRVEL